MSWRTLLITSKCKLSYQNNYLIIRNEDVKMIHLSEINTIIVETTQVSITSYLINEIAQRKIKIVFCDESRDPAAELIPYYGAHNTSKRIMSQIKWNEDQKSKVWALIVKYKIKKQAEVAAYLNLNHTDKLKQYSEQVENGDKTNREGHAAKLYFNILFGQDFCRDKDCNINKALDYGYHLILSSFNKEIVSCGYITQLGINHRNEFNFFNLGCDLMESFRPLIDLVVYKIGEKEFDSEYKHNLINVLNCKIKMNGKEQYLSNAISIYTKSIIDALDNNNINMVLDYEF